MPEFMPSGFFPNKPCKEREVSIPSPRRELGEAADIAFVHSGAAFEDPVRDPMGPFSYLLIFASSVL